MPILAMLLVGLVPMSNSPSAVVTPFAHGRRGAFSLEFDDSMTSQIQNVLPLLAQYRFPATFYINPGRNDYRKDVWEEQVPKAGHELADHTLHHGDTVGAGQAAQEIGPVAKTIERVYGKPRLTVFGTPGGVKWEIPEADFRRILKENNLVFPGRQDFYQDGQGDITRFPRRALDEGVWRQLGFHGVGGQWLSTSVENLTTLLCFLDVHREELWVAPTGTVWKYVREREAVKAIDVKPDGADAFTLKLDFDRSRLEPFALYDEPLTIKVSAPSDWTKAWTVVDGERRQVAITDGRFQFDVSPKAHSIRVERS